MSLDEELAEGYKAMAEEHRRFAELVVDIAEEVWDPYGYLNKNFRKEV